MSSSRFVSSGTILAGDSTTQPVLTPRHPLAASSSSSANAMVVAAANDAAGGAPTRISPPAKPSIPTISQQQHTREQEQALSQSQTQPPDAATLQRQAEWAAVQASLDAERREREAARRAHAEGDGEKSLFAILQENKAAKQAAFEEANAIRNQFRALDDDEIDFLDGVADRKRKEEERRRREEEDGLREFRKRQKELEGRGGGGGSEGGADGVADTRGDGVADAAAMDGGGDDGDVVVAWENAGRKRKRDKDGGGTHAPRIGGLKGVVKRKISVAEDTSGISTTTTTSSTTTTTTTTTQQQAREKSVDGKSSSAPAPAKPAARAGLVAYDSDDDDDDDD